MALYRISLSHGSRQTGQSASAKSDYICRAGKYENQADKQIHIEHSLPPLGFTDMNHFWEMADQHERANGRLFSEMKISIPVELHKKDQQIEVIREFAQTLLPNQPYTFAIHEGKGHNPHAHLIYSDRGIDGVERSPENFFKRANSKAPEKGGAKKNRELQKKDWLKGAREHWEDVANQHLKKAFKYKVFSQAPQISHKKTRSKDIPTATGINQVKRILEKELNNVRTEQKRCRRDVGGTALEIAKFVRVETRTEREDLGRSKKRLYERNKELKAESERSKEREREIERSLRRSEQLRKESTLKREHDLESIRDGVRRIEEQYGVNLKRSPGASPGINRPVLRRTEQTELSDQLSLKDFESAERQIKNRYERVRRDNPRMDGSLNGVREAIFSGIAKVSESIIRFRERAKSLAILRAKTWERHTTILKILSNKIKIPFDIKRVEDAIKPRLKLKAPAWQEYTMSPTDPPKSYICPIREKERLRERLYEAQSKQEIKPPNQGWSIA